MGVLFLVLANIQRHTEVWIGSLIVVYPHLVPIVIDLAVNVFEMNLAKALIELEGQVILHRTGA